MRKGLRTRAFDIIFGQNILEPKTFKEFLFCVCSLRARGLLWQGLPCSSFVFLSRAQTKRSKTNLYGCSRSLSATVGNGHLARSVVASLLAFLISVDFCIEQPPSSLLPSIKEMVHLLSIAKCRFTVTWLAAFGSLYMKPVRLMCSAPWMASMRRLKPKRELQHKFLVTYKMKNGKKQVSGKQNELVLSSAYPPAFGKAVVEYFSAHLKTLYIVRGPHFSFCSAF